MAEDTNDTVVAAWEKGKKYSSVAIVIAAFLHSLYATYLKPEVEARRVFTETTKSVEQFSTEVDLQVAVLQGRVDTLENVILSLQSQLNTRHPGSPPVAAATPLEGPPELPEKKSAGLKYNPPQAPWEQRAVTEAK